MQRILLSRLGYIMRALIHSAVGNTTIYVSIEVFVNQFVKSSKISVCGRRELDRCNSLFRRYRRHMIAGLWTRMYAWLLGANGSSSNDDGLAGGTE